MNIVAKSDLNFHGNALVPVSNITGTWLTSSDLAKALEYSNSRAVTMLYNKYADEFTSGMTQVLEVSTTGNYRKRVRVFSLRGAHLIAMFARTPVAKEFRRWVLDILDREVTQSPIATRLSDDDIVSFCYLQIWMEKAQRVSKEIYPAIRQLGSEFSGIMYDLGNESRFVTKPTRDILMREIQNLDMNKVKGRNAEGMLRNFKDTKELH
ncbi:BRO-N domain-containing protein [Rosenbergiella collisarenosi]|uniref:BRO-N domain-containing protein n=1 Tax=Rosenbergiella collisarenosi TaxID=1544695 RepID=UPI001F4EAA36|nr:Bro-N domain-containing protein [Rosenbergiella collisarenosi]